MKNRKIVRATMLLLTANLSNAAIINVDSLKSRVQVKAPSDVHASNTAALQTVSNQSRKKLGDADRLLTALGVDPKKLVETTGLLWRSNTYSWDSDIASDLTPAAKEEQNTLSLAKVLDFYGSKYAASYASAIEALDLDILALGVRINGENNPDGTKKAGIQNKELKARLQDLYEIALDANDLFNAAMIEAEVANFMDTKLAGLPVSAAIDQVNEYIEIARKQKNQTAEIIYNTALQQLETVVENIDRLNRLTNGSASDALDRAENELSAIKSMLASSESNFQINLYQQIIKQLELDKALEEDVAREVQIAFASSTNPAETLEEAQKDLEALQSDLRKANSRSAKQKINQAILKQTKYIELLTETVKNHEKIVDDRVKKELKKANGDAVRALENLLKDIKLGYSVRDLTTSLSPTKLENAKIAKLSNQVDRDVAKGLQDKIKASQLNSYNPNSSNQGSVQVDSSNTPAGVASRYYAALDNLLINSGSGLRVATLSEDKKKELAKALAAAQDDLIAISQESSTSDANKQLKSQKVRKDLLTKSTEMLSRDVLGLDHAIMKSGSSTDILMNFALNKLTDSVLAPNPAAASDFDF